MSNEIATIDEMSDADLDAFLGIDTSVRLPKLAVEYRPEYELKDDDGKSTIIRLPRGKWSITQNTEDGYVAAYADNIVFKPYLHTYKYLAYDNAEKAYVLTTSPFKLWGDVVIDSKGGEWPANRYKASAMKAYPDLADKIKCHQFVYGLVTFKDATDMYDKPVTVENVPCVLVGKGINYGPVNDIFQDKRRYIFFDMTIGVKRESNGSTTWFEYLPEWTSEKDKPKYTKADIDKLAFGTFAELFKKESDEIAAKYIDKVQTPLKELTGSTEPLDSDFEHTVVDDLNDDLPEEMQEGLMA